MKLKLKFFLLNYTSDFIICIQIFGLPPKELVDKAPGPVKEGVPKAEAESIKAALEAAGADVELK